jgi:hypothetical protein
MRRLMAMIGGVGRRLTGLPSRRELNDRIAEAQQFVKESEEHVRSAYEEAAVARSSRRENRYSMIIEQSLGIGHGGGQKGKR